MQRDQLADFLRRKEAAMLAGMSVDCVVRLEQGRSSQPSPQVLGALARALRLSDDERDHHVYRWFTDPAARDVHPPEEHGYTARRLVADLRAVAGRRSGDATVTGLVERLHAVSAEFRRLWADHEVAVRRADCKTILHPRVGRLLMDGETLLTPDQGQQLLVLTPADTEARERLDLLRVLGIEEFPAGTAGRPASGHPGPRGRGGLRR